MRHRTLGRLVLMAGTLSLLAGPALALSLAQAEAVDLDRFDGRWFEIVRNPNDVQKDCSRAQIDFTSQNRAGRRVQVTMMP